LAVEKVYRELTRHERIAERYLQHQFPYQRVCTPLVQVSEVDRRLLISVLILWSRHVAPSRDVGAE
jgi:hypothetical protein